MSDSHITKSPAAQFRTGFWDAPTREHLSGEDVFLLMYLLLCPYRHATGIFRLNWRLAASHLGWDQPQLVKVIERLAAAEAVVTEEGWLWVTSFFDHNNSPGPGVYSNFSKHLASAPENLVSAWRRDALDRGLPVHLWFQEDVFQGGSSPPSTPPSTPPGTGVKSKEVTDKAVKDKRVKGKAVAEDGETAAAAHHPLILEDRNPFGIIIENVEDERKFQLLHKVLGDEDLKSLCDLHMVKGGRRLYTSQLMDLLPDYQALSSNHAHSHD